MCHMTTGREAPSRFPPKWYEMRFRCGKMPGGTPLPPQCMQYSVQYHIYLGLGKVHSPLYTCPFCTCFCNVNNNWSRNIHKTMRLATSTDSVCAEAYAVWHCPPSEKEESRVQPGYSRIGNLPGIRMRGQFHLLLVATTSPVDLITSPL